MTMFSSATLLCWLRIHLPQSNRTAPNQTSPSNRSAPNQTNQSNHASAEATTEVSSIELEKQDHNHRVYLVLQFLSWEVYKVVIPLMYLASVYIIMNSSNRIWMGGLGRTAYQYTLIPHNSYLYLTLSWPDPDLTLTYP